MNKQEPTKKSLLLSVSSVDTFKTCKAKWYYHYVKKLPTPKNYHLTAGSFIHKILEIFLKRYKKSKDLKDAARVAFNLAIKDPELMEDLTKEIKLEGRDWLKEILKIYEDSPELVPNVLRIEAPFNFKLTDDISIRGFIDRIDSTEEDTIEIIDYKTNSNPDYLKPFQLITYAIAMEKKYPKKKIKASYQLIRHGFKKKDVEITEQGKQNVIETFISAGSEITNLMTTCPDTPWEATRSKLCSYCSFRIQCEKDNQSSNSWEV